MTGVLEARQDDVERLWSAEPLPFAESEQALLLGHPLHPTPKGLCGRLAQFTPELRPQFPLHWLSVDAERVVHDSAVGAPAPELAAPLLGRALRSRAGSCSPRTRGRPATSRAPRRSCSRAAT